MRFTFVHWSWQVLGLIGAIQPLFLMVYLSRLEVLDFGTGMLCLLLMLPGWGLIIRSSEDRQIRREDDILDILYRQPPASDLAPEELRLHPKMTVRTAPTTMQQTLIELEENDYLSYRPGGGYHLTSKGRYRASRRRLTAFQS